MNGGQAVTVRCKVLTGLSYQQEAELVYQISQGQKRLSLADTIYARLEAKSDPALNDVKQITAKVGYNWPIRNVHPGPYDILANRALVNAYKLLGVRMFEMMLCLLKSTWKGDPASVSGVMLSGMALFLKTYEGTYSDQVFIKHLALVQPKEIEKKANSDYSTSNNALRCAKAIWNQYNKGCRGNRKLPYLFQG